MLKVVLDKQTGTVTLLPEGALSAQDFECASSIIDPYLEKSGNLKGVIILTQSFPGWESFGALLKHFKFVKDHHEKVSKVALVTDSLLGDIAEIIAGHFVSAEIKHFPFDELNVAQNWILNP
jgi:hypothetical protein